MLALYSVTTLNVSIKTTFQLTAYVYTGCHGWSTSSPGLSRTKSREP